MCQRLYCLHETESVESAYERCGISLLSASQRQLQDRRQRCFAWLYVGLVLFCLGMMLWLLHDAP